MANSAVHPRPRFFAFFCSAILSMSPCPPNRTAVPNPATLSSRRESFLIPLCLFVRARKSSRLPQISHWREFYHIPKPGTGKGNGTRDWFRSISVSPISLPLSPHPPLEPISLKPMATLRRMAA